jgi:hypothetical protein
MNPLTRRRRTTLVLALGATEASLLIGIGWWPGIGLPRGGLLLFAAAFCAYVLAARLTDTDPTEDRGTIASIWCMGIAMRVALLPLAPELSDDVWRYLWDGHVQLGGVNPYLYAPSDAALDPLATPWRHLVNNPDVPTIYPPVAQVMFWIVAALGGGLVGIKLLWLVFDLSTAWLLVRVAEGTGRPRGPVLLLYLWSPLLVLETAWSGHLEVLGLFGMVLALLAASTARGGPRSAGAGAALAWAALTKIAPAAAIPPLTRRMGAPFVIGGLAFAAILYAPYASAGPVLLSGLGTYARHWRFNEFGFAFIELLAPGPVSARAVAAILVLAVVAWTTLRRFDPERALFWILGTGFLVTPTLHPWYALWMLPFAALRRSAAWVVFTGTVFVGYWGLGSYHETGTWPQPLWGRFLLWIPVLALLAVQSRTRRPDPEPSEEGG